MNLVQVQVHPSGSGPEFCLNPGSKSSSIPTPTSTPPAPMPAQKLNLTLILATSASAVLTCTSLITIGTCILCRKKNCSYLHKLMHFHINKKENSSHFPSVDIILSQYAYELDSPNELDPLLPEKPSEEPHESAKTP